MSGDGSKHIGRYLNTMFKLLERQRARILEAVIRK